MRSPRSLYRLHDLVQRPTACDLHCPSPSPSPACLAPTSVECVHHSTCCQFSSCRLTRKCKNCPRFLYCCSVILICMMRHRLCGCSFVGCLRSWYHMRWCCHLGLTASSEATLLQSLADQRIPISVSDCVVLDPATSRDWTYQAFIEAFICSDFHPFHNATTMGCCLLRTKSGLQANPRSLCPAILQNIDGSCSLIISAKGIHSATRATTFSISRLVFKTT